MSWIEGKVRGLIRDRVRVLMTLAFLALAIWLAPNLAAGDADCPAAVAQPCHASIHLTAGETRLSFKVHALFALADNSAELKADHGQADGPSAPARLHAMPSAGVGTRTRTGSMLLPTVAPRTDRTTVKPTNSLPVTVADGVRSEVSSPLLA
jgi:hypothetical protein